MGFFFNGKSAENFGAKGKAPALVQELRAALGGIPAGRSVMALLPDDPAIYMAFGVAMAGATLAPFYSMAVDEAPLSVRIVRYKRL